MMSKFEKFISFFEKFYENVLTFREKFDRIIKGCIRCFFLCGTVCKGFADPAEEDDERIFVWVNISVPTDFAEKPAKS